MAEINGTENADTLEGTNDNDRIDGLSGDDQINGGQGADRLDGADGNDQLNGGQGSDLVLGGAGDDRLTDNANGDDKLFGGDGNDIIAVSRNGVKGDKIQIDGGAGNDTITYTSENAAKVNLIIDAGNGANNISVEEAKEITVISGGDVDTISVEVGTTGRVHSGGEADLISAKAAQSAAHTGISSGHGADSVTLDINNNAHYRLKLGDGQDIVTLTAEGTDASDFKVKVKDFAAGDSGDKLDLDAYLASAVDGTVGANAFADGHLKLVQVGDDAVLQFDRDGAGTAFGFEDVVWFQDSTAANFTAFNFDGMDPTPDAAAPDSDFVV
jgi:Ca2+-binding RTX toxin-like protein